MTGQLVGTGKSLCAPGEMATMGLLACVCPDVSRLMLEAVEGFLAKGALVRAREVCTPFGGRAIIQGRYLQCGDSGGHTRISGMRDSVW